MQNLKTLLSLKPWVTIPDAARHLSILFGEDVTEADVLRLGLDGRLMLSVYFVNPVTGCLGPVHLQMLTVGVFPHCLEAT
jgi:hypothetical protein